MRHFCSQQALETQDLCTCTSVACGVQNMVGFIVCTPGKPTFPGCPAFAATTTANIYVFHQLAPLQQSRRDAEETYRGGPPRGSGGHRLPSTVRHGLGKVSSPPGPSSWKHLAYKEVKGNRPFALTYYIATPSSWPGHEAPGNADSSSGLG